MGNSHLRKLKGLLSHLQGHIVGQDAVLAEVAEALQIGELGLTDESRPKCSFLFLGPTGVGKTETVVTFTNHLFGNDRLVRLDMSEYKTRDSLKTLLGEGSHTGTLERQYDRVSAWGTLLMDEIEKAHREVLDLLLQLLDAGRLTTGGGRTLDFGKFYIVLTSNIGSETLLTLKHSNRTSRTRFVETEAQQQLRPETFARLNRVLVFESLGYDQKIEVTKALIERELKLQARHGYVLKIGEEVLRFLTNKGYHPTLGARPLRDAIEKHIRRALSEHLLAGCNGCGQLNVEGDRLILT